VNQGNLWEGEASMQELSTIFPKCKPLKDIVIKEKIKMLVKVSSRVMYATFISDLALLISMSAIWEIHRLHGVLLAHQKTGIGMLTVMRDL
jgi:hypothetical protein